MSRRSQQIPMSGSYTPLCPNEAAQLTMRRDIDSIQDNLRHLTTLISNMSQNMGRHTPPYQPNPNDPTRPGLSRTFIPHTPPILDPQDPPPPLPYYTPPRNPNHGKPPSPPPPSLKNYHDHYEIDQMSFSTSNTSASHDRRHKENDRGWKIELPEFEGGENPDDYLGWVDVMERYFDRKEYDEEKKFKIAIFKLKGNASFWWESVWMQRQRENRGRIKSWKKLKGAMEKHFLPPPTLPLPPTPSPLKPIPQSLVPPISISTLTPPPLEKPTQYLVLPSTPPLVKLPPQIPLPPPPPIPSLPLKPPPLVLAPQIHMLPIPIVDITPLYPSPTFLNPPNLPIPIQPPPLLEVPSFQVTIPPLAPPSLFLPSQKHTLPKSLPQLPPIIVSPKTLLHLVLPSISSPLKNQVLPQSLLTSHIDVYEGEFDHMHIVVAKDENSMGDMFIEVVDEEDILRISDEEERLSLDDPFASLKEEQNVFDFFKVQLIAHFSTLQKKPIEDKIILLPILVSSDEKLLRDKYLGVIKDEVILIFFDEDEESTLIVYFE